MNHESDHGGYDIWESWAYSLYEVNIYATDWKSKWVDI